jgi:small subunit ribosomal protein S3
MGQKTHPIGFRLGVNKNWNSIWAAPTKQDYARLLHQDLKIRDWIKRTYYNAAIDKIIVKRIMDRIFIEVHCAKIGIVIGKKAAGIERIKNFISQVSKIPKDNISVDIIEIRNPDLSAQLIAENIASQMEKNIPYRPAMKRAVTSVLRAGAKGIKINCEGRLGGVEIARAEWILQGRLPLQTIRADIDYGFAVAKTKWGTNGVTVWIFKGEILGGGVVR